ncbi:RSH [Haematococcus lacustris]|uniref:RSH n=1 Tax=Haematococcus lacustris TaxID=44745 RepID=A0A699ZZB2_HAELA|nr:RSH [Haematococcus lacustris]
MNLGPVSSSPLAVGSKPVGLGYKQRSSQLAKGTTTVQPRLSSSSLQGILTEADQRGLASAEALFKHFSLSGPQRRSVTCSPTQGQETGAQTERHTAFAGPITFGFEPSPKACDSIPASPFTSETAPSASLARAASKAPAKAGLLTRALTHDLPENQVGGLSSLNALAGQRKGSQYFPDVDNTLLQDLQERHAVFHTDLVCTAYMLASKAHAGQHRKDGTSMLSHCVMAALQLAELGLDAETVAAGLLHEALGINAGFRPQVEEFMPRSVIHLMDRVQTISEISSLYRKCKGQLGEEKMRRSEYEANNHCCSTLCGSCAACSGPNELYLILSAVLLAMEDVKAMLIKLACRVHDMKTVAALPRDAQISLAQETLDIYSVVANRLGIWSLKAELEDLAFAVLHPEECEALREQVAKRQNPVALEATITAIKSGLDARGLRCEDISGRPKNLWGIWCKMQSSGITSLDKVYDVTALRVVVANKHDCYVALRVVQETYRTMSGRSKDYIREEKKPNGYQSLHETIFGADGLPVEVQIRTHKMHFIAEYGFAAHWKYKEKLPNEDEWLDKEVQYKKWLMTYKLGVHDKKVRATGAPKQDCALTSLGMHLLDSATGSADAVGVDPFLRHDRFKLGAPIKQRVSVVVATQDGIDAKELPANQSAQQLSDDLLGPQGLPGYTMTVNRRIPAPEYLLQTGDLVQVLPLAQALSQMPELTPQAAASAPSDQQHPLQLNRPLFPGRVQQLRAGGASCPASCPAPSSASRPAPGSVRLVNSVVPLPGGSLKSLGLSSLSVVTSFAPVSGRRRDSLNLPRGKNTMEAAELQAKPQAASS